MCRAAHRTQADAFEIEAGAKRRLADEYDAAQERGEVRGHGNRSDIPKQNITVKDTGLTSKQVHDTRAVRDAELKRMIRLSFGGRSGRSLPAGLAPEKVRPQEGDQRDPQTPLMPPTPIADRTLLTLFERSEQYYDALWRFQFGCRNNDAN